MSGINEQVINAEIYQIGPQGIPGEAATVSVGTVTTGEPGTDASVTNSGTSSAAILDFVIPQGEQGLQGIQGPQGIQGLTGATGNGISSIEKITTVGLTDTYRITFTNNTYYDFEVINGSSISDIEKTNTSGLVDTYTITLTNGNTHTFTVTNGAKGDKGETGEVGNGILGVNKMSTTGLVDNYRMTFTNGTYFDFDVTNAKSIVSISKIMTTGLVDTYRITFNDGSSFQFPVTNGNGVSGVTLLSWVGLDKTYRMTFTNGTYFDFTVSNGAEGQAEWGGISGVLSNQHDLQDALDLKANTSQTHALKSYSDNGELLTDAEGLADVKEYAHSSFDRSKFTVVGSPTITDDGIASGFSSHSEMIKIIKASELLNKSWTIKVVCNGKGGSLGNPISFTTGYGNVNSGGLQTSYSVAHMYLNLKTGDSVDTQQLAFNNTYAMLGIPDDYRSSDIVITLSFDIQTGTYTWSLRKISETTTYKTITYTPTSTNKQLYEITTGTDAYIAINTAFTNVAYNASETYDLKQFSITVDGVEVFSGNKTGIDTIKPDDYTVVGTPTISADGVVSGFVSQTNYIIGSFAPVSAKNKIELWGAIINNPADTDGSVICATNGNLRITKQSANVIGIRGLAGGLTVNSSNLHLQDGDFVIAHAIVTTTDATLQTWVNGVKQTDVTVSGDFSAVATSYDSLYIGGQYNNGNYSPASRIDMNYCKVHIDGNLAYQPCLKIPYTESKTGSKIVNAIYRDRVNDMAEQFGYANYYTLSDTDFTLPQVELFGLMGDKTLRDSYYNGVTYWELYSNRRLEQGGSCESGVEYTLPKPFADANYVLTIPYSSKTATSFIPSATGDFIAKGTGLL